MWRMSVLGTGANTRTMETIQEEMETFYGSDGYQSAKEGIFKVYWGGERRHRLVPRAQDYHVLPVGKHKGFMKFVNGSTSFKDFNWKKWAKKATPEQVERLVCSAAGSFIAGYLLGVRDRHWDNIMIQNDETLVQIDFNFILGDAPPADGPLFSISQDMKNALTELGVWELLLDLAASAFVVMRLRCSDLSRLACLVFSETLNWRKPLISGYLIEPLKLKNTLEQAKKKVRAELDKSAQMWSTWFKQLTHATVDPVLYFALKRHFTPAEMIMASVERKAAKKASKHRDKDHQGITAHISS